jgi:hypothetical protein
METDLGVGTGILDGPVDELTQATPASTNHGGHNAQMCPKCEPDTDATARTCRDLRHCLCCGEVPTYDSKTSRHVCKAKLKCNRIKAKAKKEANEQKRREGPASGTSRPALAAQGYRTMVPTAMEQLTG